MEIKKGICIIASTNAINMKRQIRFILFLFIVSLTACQKQPHILPLLQEAETLMDSRPDSSLCLLESVQSPENLSAAEYATWCLLVTQARDKNYVEHTSDSVIGVAVRYFEKRKDVKRKAFSFYYQGRVNQDMGNKDNALVNYLSALDMAEKQREHKLCGLICNKIGQIYREQYMEDKAYPYFEDANSYYGIANDTVGQIFALRNIGRYYAEKMPSNPDSAILMYKQAYELAVKNGHKPVQSSLLNDMGAEYKQLGQYSVALDYVLQSIALSAHKESLLFPKYSNLGDLYMKIGCYDSARYYLQKSIRATDLATKAGSYSYLAKLEATGSQYEKAYACQDSFIKYMGLIDISLYNEKLIAIEKQYNIKKAVLDVEKEALKRRSIWICLVGLTTISLLILIIVYLRLKRKKTKELQIKQQEISRLHRLEEEHRRQDRKNPLEKISQNENVHDRLIALQHSILAKSLIYERISPYIGKKRKNKQDNQMEFSNLQWEEFLEAVNAAYTGFLSWLRNEYGLEQDQLIIAALIKLQINPVHMQLVLKINSPSLITRRKKNLAEKLNISATQLEEFLSSC